MGSQSFPYKYTCDDDNDACPMKIYSTPQLEFTDPFPEIRHVCAFLNARAFYANITHMRHVHRIRKELSRPADRPTDASYPIIQILRVPRTRTRTAPTTYPEYVTRIYKYKDLYKPSLSKGENKDARWI